MMNIYATAGLYNEVLEMMGSMRRNGWSPDSDTYLVLVRAYTKGCRHLEGEKVIEEMEKEGVQPSCAHFNALLVGYTKAGLMEEAERVYGEVGRFGLSPDVECRRTMLRGYVEGGEWEGGISFLESGGGGEAERDRFMMSAAVELYRRGGLEGRAAEVLRCMRSLGIPFLNNLKEVRGSFRK